MAEDTDGLWNGAIAAPGDSQTGGDGFGVFPMHAALLHTGEILMFAGHVEAGQYLLESYVWDPTQPVGSARKQDFPTDTDLFCCHLVTLEDGEVLVVGGADAAAGNGIKAITLFDPLAPDATAWEKIGEMHQARWYPTAVNLPDGRVVAFSGRQDPDAGPGVAIAETAELFSPPFEGPGYGTTTLVGGDKLFPTYPSLHLVRGGRIFHTGTTWQYEGPGTTDPIGTFSFQVTSPTSGAWTDHGTGPSVAFRQEGMAVLLPPAQDGKILLAGGGKPIASNGLAAGSDPVAAEILDTQTSPPTWTRVADLNHARVNATLVLLPDGKVLAIGGSDQHRFSTGQTPSNQAEIYDPVADTWTAVATMSEPRMYHSVALLLPDGRVWVGGGYDPNFVDPNTSDGNRKTMELYQPPYFFNGTRPDLAGRTNPDGPDDEIAYGRSVLLQTPQAPQIAKVVLMRPGAVTHHTDSEQRWVPLDFVQTGAQELRAAVIGDPTVAPPGYYMLWLVDQDGLPCKQAEFVQLTRRQCEVVTDRSHFSMDEIDPAAGAATVFPASFYVVMDGFLPSELGVATATPTPAQLDAVAPTISFLRDGASEATISAEPEELLLEDDTLPPVRQRFTFRYAVHVAGTGAFLDAAGDPIELQTLTLRAEKAGYPCTAPIALTNQPNPYMLDGDTSWLSIDLRVFQLEEGQARFDRTVGSGSNAALDYIQGVLVDLNADPAAARPLFEALATDQADSTLELARAPGGTPVYNFAVAQVRYRGRTLEATDVRVFFRAFTTAATGLEFRSATTYRRLTNPAGDPIAALGLVGGELTSIPFFATQRVNTSLQSMGQQTDPPNVRTIPADASGAERTAYFGCWLDLNQTALRFPNQPGGDGPYTSGMKSIQELIRGQHQCLVAELVFDGDPIPEGATPAANDNLSQRNLAIVESDNPGSVATHTVAHTFEVRPGRRRFPVTPATHFAAAKPALFSGMGPDELMFRWGSLPRDAEVEIYLPGVEADAILALAIQRLAPHVFEKVDDHTVRCRVGDVTFLPIPPVGSAPLAGLLTVRLPATVRRGDAHRIAVHEIDGATHRILGAFDLLVQVRDRDALALPAGHTLSLFKHVSAAIPAGDRWRPVFDRWLGILAERARGFGIDPDRVEPSPDGDGVSEDAAGGILGSRACRRLLRLLVAAVALLVIGLGLVHPGAALALGLVGLAGSVGGLAAWIKRCGRTLHAVCVALGIGVGLGGAVLGVAWLLGWPAVHAPVMILALLLFGLGLAGTILARR